MEEFNFYELCKGHLPTNYVRRYRNKLDYWFWSARSA